MNVLQEWLWQLVGWARTCTYKDYETGINAWSRAGIDQAEGFELDEKLERALICHMFGIIYVLPEAREKMDVELHSDIS